MGGEIMEAILNGIYTDKDLTVPANTVLEEDTVLGEVTATQKLSAYKSDATDGSQNPCYVLANKLVNDTEEPKDFSNVRVLACGDVNAGKLKLAKDGDTVAEIATKLKNNGILAVNVQNGIGEQ